MTKLTHTLNIFHQLLLVKKHILETGSTSITEDIDWLHLLDPTAYILFYPIMAAQKLPNNMLFNHNNAT
jgi:hypothetical protein